MTGQSGPGQTRRLNSRDLKETKEFEYSVLWRHRRNKRPTTTCQHRELCTEAMGPLYRPPRAAVLSTCRLVNGKMAKRMAKPAPEASMGLSHQVRQELLLVGCGSKNFQEPKPRQTPGWQVNWTKLRALCPEKRE